MTVLEKLGKIQAELKAPKGQFNSFGKYNYRSCEDILEAAKPLLKANNCLIMINDNLSQVGERYYISAEVSLYDCETGEKIYCTAYAREEESKKGMDGSQVTGAASSYARKYALNGLLAIDDAKDSDSTNKHGAEEKKTVTIDKPIEKPKVEPSNRTLITEAQRKRLYAIAKGNTELIKSVVNGHDYESSKEIQVRDYEAICKEIEEGI